MTLDDLSILFKPNTPSTQRAAVLRDALSAALIVCAALLVWEVAVRARNVPVYILPAPSVVASALWKEMGYYIAQSLVTLGEALGGLALGLVIGIAVAIFITFWKHLERGILALAMLIKTTPLVAIAPLLIIWFGFGPLPKIIITGLITFFPVLVNVHSGLHAVDGGWAEVEAAPARRVVTAQTRFSVFMAHLSRLKCYSAKARSRSSRRDGPPED